MARILVHALAATAGGGAHYLRHLLGHAAELGTRHRWIVLTPPGAEAAHSDVAPIEVRPGPSMRGFLHRIAYDQLWIRRLVRRENVDLLLATGNFGLVRPPVPQVLLNRNALYFSRDHLRVLRERGDLAEMANILLRRRMALASIASSRVNVVPTAAFGRDIREYLPRISHRRFQVVPHGFDHDRFRHASQTLDAALFERLSREPGVRRILLVSHYNYFRNFETLLRAAAILKDRSSRPIELVLTTRIGRGVKDHRYDTTAAARLIEKLGIERLVTMLGTVPHSQLPALYRAADVVVCPSYAESFGHPMVEAMASGRPIVASNRPTHREICGDAAIYFDVFDPAGLADALERVLSEDALAAALGQRGVRRARQFCWRLHFETILETVETVLREEASCPA